MKLFILLLAIGLAGCQTTREPEGPSKDWQKDLQRAIDQQRK
jgi:uncharacterized lipoprotein